MTGKVTDRITGQPMPYANVYISDTLGNPVEPVKGTATDANGNYRLAILPGDYVTASFVGYEKQTKKSNGTVNFELKGGTELSEVEIVAKKRNKKVFVAGGIILFLLATAITYNKYAGK